jgi:hypothetical protein
MNRLHALYHRPLMRFVDEDREGEVCIELSVTTVETVIRDDKPFQNFRTTCITADVDQLENLIRILGDAARRATKLQASICIIPIPTDH